jgi:hypothetical protein
MVGRVFTCTVRVRFADGREGGEGMGGRDGRGWEGGGGGGGGGGSYLLGVGLAHHHATLLDNVGSLPHHAHDGAAREEVGEVVVKHLVCV